MEGIFAIYCILLVVQVQGHYWTSWFDRDNPSGTGDWETLSDQKALGEVCGVNCDPIAAECRVKGTTTVFTRWAGTAPDKLLYHCLPSKGLACRNADNPEICKDYEIRYKCPSTSTTWTSWLDRDDPSGTGDWEHVGKTGFNPCSNNDPIKIECRVKGTNQPWDQAGQVIRTKCTPSEGFVCVNADQPSGETCKDYEVRFICP
ncbi:mucin-5AC-like [Lingula anatina]|uniref:Mucin-5AC-like n=1 Tax=Lingula anatina TaxID=7574 RepID=A0A1S3INJ9_LINAN|nr:mucin-5AC-like [Lingula anatina]|eukprot:XP_013399109.1 mucin-5AC-like [Lingula anatina]